MRRIGASVACLGLGLWPGLLAACPLCSDLLAHDPGGRGFARGIYYSILLLFAVLGTLVFFVVRAVVKEARRDSSSGRDSGT